MNRMVRTSGRTLILTALAAELLVSLQSYVKFGFFGQPKAEGEGVAAEHIEIEAANMNSEDGNSQQGHVASQDVAAAQPGQPYLAPNPDLLI